MTPNPTYTITTVLDTLDTLLWVNDFSKYHWFRQRLIQCRTEEGFQKLKDEVEAMKRMAMR